MWGWVTLGVAVLLVVVLGIGGTVWGLSQVLTRDTTTPPRAEGPPVPADPPAPTPPPVPDAEDEPQALDDLLGQGGLEGLLGEGGLEELLGEGGIEDLEALLGGEGSDLGGMLEGLLGGGGGMGQLMQCIGAPSGGGGGDLPDDPDAAIDVLADQVAAERGLSSTRAIDPVLLEPAALRDRVEQLTLEDYPADVADIDARLLAAYGAIDGDVDLRQLQVDLLGEQVAGFYDPETGELVSVSTDGLDPTTTVTLAHEIDHALTDQALGMPDLDGFEGRVDEGLASLALIEGDATLVMQRWAMQHLSLSEQLGMTMGSMGQARGLAATPWMLQQQLLFPYTEGLELVCDQFADGGWAAVDAMYDDPPTTTAQVLWPDRYRAGEGAVDVPDPAVPSGFQEVRRDQLGAAELLWLFEAPGDDQSVALSDPEGRAQAWAGGEVAVATRGQDTAVTVTLAEHDDAPLALCDSMTSWYGAAFPDARQAMDGDVTTFTGDGQAAAIRCDGSTVRLGIAPDATTAAAAIAR